jgi:threonine/homoserine/homoserine lactone efflux protein
VLAAGIVTGSYFWSITAALGFGAILMAHVWILETVRYCGAAYLLYLACRSLRAAMSDTDATMTELKAPHGYFMAGLMLHLTNPKPVLFSGHCFRSVFSPRSRKEYVALVVLVVGLCDATIFIAYALLFSHTVLARLYAGARRWFESVFALLFGIAGVKILTFKLTQ